MEPKVKELPAILKVLIIVVSVLFCWSVFILILLIIGKCAGKI